ncbi:nuclease-related domain-containing protein [Streptomyces olivaceiscleroticus]|uniref:NERD domain-containing protein n=1 Tax=Streptomyces olivaceiscleroticus TaxID=68245 RepID=A0ABP3LHI8_9ACTN
MSAGNSAAAHAAQVGRGRLWQRLLAGAGYITPGYAQAQQQARSWGEGAVGEAWTKKLLAPLAGESWWVLHDRRIGDRANLDHVLVSPCARLVVVDSKRWRADWPVRMARGRVCRGPVDVTEEVAKAGRLAEWARQTVGAESVLPIVAVHGAPVAGGGFQEGTVAVLPADRLLAELRSIAGQQDPRAEELAAKANRLLPRYVQ